MSYSMNQGITLKNYDFFYFKNVSNFEDDSYNEKNQLNASNLTFGTHISFRYEVLDHIDSGTFGKVYKVHDHKHSRNLALKMIQTDATNIQQLECEILKLIKQSGHKAHFCRMRGFFRFKTSTCITMDLLDTNLLFYIHSQPNGLKHSEIRNIGVSVLKGLSFLHSIKIVHCDIKPENIMLKYGNKQEFFSLLKAKIVDLGSACLEKKPKYSYIQSRFYRAPEVILGIKYGRQIDLWSFGCVLFEMFSTKPLFPSKNEHELINLICNRIGYPSTTQILHAERYRTFFNLDGSLKNCTNRPNRNYKKNCKNQRPELTTQMDHLLQNNINVLIRWNANERVEAKTMLKSNYFL